MQEHARTYKKNKTSEHTRKYKTIKKQRNTLKNKTWKCKDTKSEFTKIQEHEEHANKTYKKMQENIKIQERAIKYLTRQEHKQT